MTVQERIVLQSICGDFKNLDFVRIPQKIDMSRPLRRSVCHRSSLVDIRSMGRHHLKEIIREFRKSLRLVLKGCFD